MPMTPRQRWSALLMKQPTDRLPTDYWATPEFHKKLRQALDCPTDEALWRRLGIDRLRGADPRWKYSHHPDDPQANMWGMRHRRIDYGAGAYDEVAFNPLGGANTADDVLAFRWPDPDDFDYSVITDQLLKDDGYRMIQGGCYEPFWIYRYMRGDELAYEDFLAAPEIVAAALDKIFTFHHEYNRRIFDAGRGRIDMMYLAEDLGAQTGPLFGLDIYRRFFLPNQRKMAGLARSYGVHLFYHTDGAARAFLPDLIHNVGIEILNPIQWRCSGMEREALARDFGGDVVFHGAVDNQYTLPFGTPEQVAEEVRRTAEIFRSCRWICAPCHNIQPNTPVENVIAMYEAAARIKATA